MLIFLIIIFNQFGISILKIKTIFRQTILVIRFDAYQRFLLYVCIKTFALMENQRNSVTPLAMSYGLYTGLALVLNLVIFYVMGTPFSSISGYISYAIIIAGIGWAMRTYREDHPEAGVSYGRALGLGTLLTLFASLILGFFTFVLFKLVDKTLIEKLLTFMEEQFLRSGLSDTQTEAFMPLYKKVLTPVTYSLGMIFSITFNGFIFSLILAIFFKKQSTDPFHGVE